MARSWCRLEPKDLFHKAMVHAATYIQPNPSLLEAEARGIARATEWGLNGATATLQQMRAVPVESLGRGVGGAIDGNCFVEPWITNLAYHRHPAVPFVVGGSSDEGALWARDRWIARQVADGGTPAFQYHFSHVRQGLDEERGALHSAELRFAWNTLRDSANVENSAVAEEMHPCWVAFAFYDGRAISTAATASSGRRSPGPRNRCSSSRPTAQSSTASFGATESGSSQVPRRS